MGAAVESTQNTETKHANKYLLAFLGVSIPESTNFGVIFFMHAAKLLDFLFGTAMRYIIFPSAAIYGITKAALAWRMLKLNRKDGKIDWNDWQNWKNLFLTIWETINAAATTFAVALGTTAAIIGVCAAVSAVIGLSISAIFTAALGATTLIHGFFTGFHIYKFYAAKKALNKIKTDSALNDEEKTVKINELKIKEEIELHKGQIKHHTIITAIVGLLTTSVVLAMIVGFPVVGGALGMAACLGSVAFSAYNIHKQKNLKKDTVDTANDVHINAQQGNQLTSSQATIQMELLSPQASPRNDNNNDDGGTLVDIPLTAVPTSTPENKANVNDSQSTRDSMSSSPRPTNRTR